MVAELRGARVLVADDHRTNRRLVCEALSRSGMAPEEFAYASQKAQLINAVCDSSGFCQFIIPTLDDIRAFYGALYSEEVSREQIHELGFRCLEDEWEFNRRAGWKDEDNDLPDCMKQDKIGPEEVVYDVPVDLANQAKTRLPYQEDMFTTRTIG